LGAARNFRENSEVPGKMFSRLRQLVDRSFVVGMILVFRVDF
jgi:hypothetical protein